MQSAGATACSFRPGPQIIQIPVDTLLTTHSFRLFGLHSVRNQSYFRSCLTRAGFVPGMRSGAAAATSKGSRGGVANSIRLIAPLCVHEQAGRSWPLNEHRGALRSTATSCASAACHAGPTGTHQRPVSDHCCR